MTKPMTFAPEMSVRQILSVWSDLVDAYYGKNGYGGDTAEIYAYRLLRDNPTRYLAVDGTQTKNDALAEDANLAACNLYGMLMAFTECYPDARIYPDCTKDKNGRALGKWYTRVQLDHRTCVRILRAS
jgi:hypothetical protein